MWNFQRRDLSPGYRVHISIQHDGSPVAYRDILQAWQEDITFQNFFTDLFTSSPYTAFRWETPPITAVTVNRPFEFVLINSPDLERPPDRKTFAPYFQTEQPTVTFPNLGNDAVLVVPCPSQTSNYSHLGAFVRQAPSTQQQALWTAIGKAMTKRLGQSPVWLSTAGGGVSWLHVRLDDSPKYYRHQPYRTHS